MVVPQSYGRDVENEVSYSEVKKATTNVKQFSCHGCGFNVSFPGVTSVTKTPSINQRNVQVLKSEKKPEKLVDFVEISLKFQVITGSTPIYKLRDDELLLITDLLQDPKDLFNFMKTCKRFSTIATKHHIWERRELICFFRYGRIDSDLTSK